MNNPSLVEKLAGLTSEDKAWLESLVDRLLAYPAPLIDPKKQDILIWPSGNEKHPNDLIVQFINQKFIGMPRVDRRGIKYWKVRKFYEEEEPRKTSTPAEVTKEEIELIAKKPMSDQTKEDCEKWAKWVKQEQLKERIESQSQKVVEGLKERLEQKNEATNA